MLRWSRKRLVLHSIRYQRKTVQQSCGKSKILARNEIVPRKPQNNIFWAVLGVVCLLFDHCKITQTQHFSTSPRHFETKKFFNCKFCLARNFLRSLLILMQAVSEHSLNLNYDVQWISKKTHKRIALCWQKLEIPIKTAAAKSATGSGTSFAYFDWIFGWTEDRLLIGTLLDNGLEADSSDWSTFDAPVVF